uniref:Uncharacterized protein n=1 Tax=Hucho hucho TaxID=62062 RepID=A0A4W5QAP6_9TELE
IHLMLAVREEVELLRKRINQLSERNAQLERENYILRSLTCAVESTTYTSTHSVTCTPGGAIV